MKLSNQTFYKTSEWIRRNARPLECARWEYFFEGASRDKVIQYLSAFQNDDGGFGNGIEPDFWSPHSSPMATWAAGQILMEIGVDSNEQVVISMLSYLENNYQKDAGLWLSVLPENNDHPHAPWWHWKEGVQKNWMYNPSAELAAFLVHWSPEDSETARIGWEVTENAVNHVMNSDSMGKHEINNFQQLANIMTPFESKFNSKMNYSLDDVSEKVMTLAEECVDKDVSSWSTGYKPLPLDFVDSPDDPLYERFGADLIEKNLQFYIAQIAEDGTWDISWNWGSYPEEFPVARRYWKGVLAVDRYKLLHSFGYAGD
ncbi:hypothetical protein [Virgibacillus doumboii]|uniref:hypothetical protein n=1 Tax=Virgibacillus doumboii TaxID=2697503 RepID=UPI0013DF31CE|nr:hypothetical protein [Virgibacillus doumboii]